MPFSFKPPQAQAAQTAFSAAAIGTKLKENKGQVFTFLCFLSVGVMAFVSVVLYTYQMSLRKTVEEKKAALAAMDSTLGDIPLDRMTKLSRKLRAAGNIVNQRTSVNTAFRLIEESIEDKSIYSLFELRINPQGQYEVTVSGEAPSYKAVVQQTEAFKLKMYGRYVLKSELLNAAPSEEGSINFNYKLTLAIRGVPPEEVLISDKPEVVSNKSSTTPQ